MTTSRQRSGSSEGEGGDARFVFDADAADRACMFIERLLCHWQGEFAGQPFILLPWQRDAVVRPLFGWKRADGTRRYRRVSVWVAKKNGNTPLGAAIALTVLFTDDEPGAEIYSVAADREQAAIVYGDGQAMVEQKRALRKRCRVLRRSILRPDTRSVWRVMSSEAKTKHGYRPHCALFDELHAQPDDALWRVLTAGTDYARRQQLILVLTTAGIYDRESIWWRVREKARQIKAGIAEDSAFLPVLYIADPDKDDPHDEELWKRVNPSLDRIFTLDRIRKDYEQAKNDLIEFEDFKRFRLNIPAKHIKRWMPMDAWDRCTDELQLETLKDRPCYGGMDLSAAPRYRSG